MLLNLILVLYTFDHPIPFLTEYQTDLQVHYNNMEVYAIINRNEVYITNLLGCSLL